ADQGEKAAASDQEADRSEGPRIELSERKLHRRPVAAPEDRENAEKKETPQRPGAQRMPFIDVTPTTASSLSRAQITRRGGTRFRRASPGARREGGRARERARARNRLPPGARLDEGPRRDSSEAARIRKPGAPQFAGQRSPRPARSGRAAPCRAM